MTLAALLALATALHPAYAHGLPARAEPRLSAAIEAALDPAEQAELVAIDFIETTFRWRDSRGRLLTPFGEFELDRNHPGPHTLVEYAVGALASLRMATEQCGHDLARRMHFYRVGRCGPVDAEARRRARLVERIVSRAVELR